MIIGGGGAVKSIDAILVFQKHCGRVRNGDVAAAEIIKVKICDWK
jgi:hypothetical protein